MSRILIVDDDTILRSTLASSLANAGHVAIEAADGREALRLLHAQPVDLVLTDIVMPEQEGLETIIALRRDRPGLPVVAMSGINERAPIYLELARKLGAGAMDVVVVGVSGRCDKDLVAVEQHRKNVEWALT